MDLLSILKKLTSIDTSIEKSTLDAVYYIKQIFDENQLISKIIPYENDINRACLIASTGNLTDMGLVLSGHLDTYGVSTQLKNWKTNPFDLNIKDDTVVGRGVVDMKGAISSFLSAIERLKNISIPIHLVLTHDEEGGFQGIKQLLENSFYGLISSKQYGCIVMEPTSFKQVICHQGYERRKIIFHNLTSEKNGYEKCNLFKNIIVDIFEHTKFEVSEHFGQREFNLNIGNIRFIDDKKATIDYQIKYSPENETVANYFIRKIDVEAYKYSYYNSPISIEHVRKNKVLPFEADSNEKFCHMVETFVGFNSNVMNFGTEAGFFQRFGIKNTIILGPGDYERAHRSNEDIKINELEEYSKFLVNLARKIEKENINNNLDKHFLIQNHHNCMKM